MKKLFFILLAGLLVLGVSGTASATLTFNLDFEQDGSYESYYEMLPSEMVWIDLYVSNVPTPGLQSMGFDFTYDFTQLEVTPGTEPSAMNWYITPSVDISIPGEVEMKGGRIGGLGPDDVLLGTIELHCIAPGTSDLWLFDSDRAYDLAPTAFNDFVLADGTVLDGQLVDGILLGTITNVPIPGAIWLLGAGFVGLAGLRRKLRS